MKKLHGLRKRWLINTVGVICALGLVCVFDRRQYLPIFHISEIVNKASLPILSLSYHIPTDNAIRHETLSTSGFYPIFFANRIAILPEQVYTDYSLSPFSDGENAMIRSILLCQSKP